jgi:hypothetical protein
MIVQQKSKRDTSRLFGNPVIFVPTLRPVVGTFAFYLPVLLWFVLLRVLPDSCCKSRPCRAAEKEALFADLKNQI